MPALLAFLFVVAAPAGEAVTLRHKFTRGMSYVDESQSRISLKLFPAPNNLLEFDHEGTQKLRRTVLKVDEKGEATQERIEVLDFTRIVHKAPDKKESEKKASRFASHGKSFIWRKSKDGKWKLYGDGDKDVTKKHPQLVERLKPWRDARLPSGPVRQGSTWTVPAEKFLRAVGQPVPKDVSGEAKFELRKLENGIATIHLVFDQAYRQGERDWKGRMQGVWKFDVARGRDLALSMKGRIEVDEGEFGTGAFRKERIVTYADR